MVNQILVEIDLKSSQLWPQILLFAIGSSLDTLNQCQDPSLNYTMFGHRIAHAMPAMISTNQHQLSACSQRRMAAKDGGDGYETLFMHLSGNREHIRLRMSRSHGSRGGGQGW